MEIGPLHNQKPQVSSVSSATEQKAKENVPSKAQSVDTVELSSDAREKMAQMADSARAKYGLGEMPTNDSSVKSENKAGLRMDKIKTAKERVKQGFYDQQHVRQEIADKMMDDIKGFSNGETE
ncbi:MAG: flagellar biosynthesis anti-sigma factor FlgM [candidate division Zixibacteria bacterium]|nr:flagellar biosynthesis anti-sigma factor FlgM [candidate division Zixibacteria bacterium]